MALTDAFLALVFAQIILYVVLYTSKTRWKRIVGAGGIIVVGFSYVLIADTIVMMILMLISLMVGGIKIFDEVSALVK